ncbi:MAG TPA: methyltransferase [Vicinamibacterales bacterium]|nr:methyltransferase [Vicinamibacterales bacterium]
MRQPAVAHASREAVDLGTGLATESLPPKLPRAARADLADRAARFLLVGLFTFLAVNIGRDFLQTARLTGLLLLASEALVVVFTAFRRAPMIVDRSLRARLLTGLSIAGPMLVRPTLLPAFAPDAITASVSACGLSIVIGGKLSLGRSFGLIPANRGIVCSGLYRFVRHPIYIGYVVTHLAFVAANPSVWNLALLAVADVALMARAICEEATLARDPEYQAYQTRVRWRVVPGVF